MPDFVSKEDAEELTISKKQQWRCPNCHGIHPLLYTGSGTGVINLMNPSELIAQQGTHRTIAFHNIGIKIQRAITKSFQEGIQKTTGTDA